MRSVQCLWVRLCGCALAGELMVSTFPSCSDLGGCKCYQYSCQVLFLEVLFCLFTKILFSLNWSQCTGTRAESSHLVLPLKPWCASGCVSVTFLVAGYSIANNREAKTDEIIPASNLEVSNTNRRQHMFFSGLFFDLENSHKLLWPQRDGSCLEWRLSPTAFGTITV